MITQPKTIDDIKQNREEWAQALVSGAYEQGKDSLRQGTYADGHTYCCLGVLQHRVNMAFFASDDNRGDGYPPTETLRLVGLPNANGGHMNFDGKDPNETDRLVIANDEGKTFPEIAQMIRDLPLPTEVPS